MQLLEDAPSVAAAALSIRDLVVRYGSFTAVDRLTLELRPGELFGLLGPNGAGKSSTIRVLIGQRRPSAGSVAVLGHDVVREWDRVKELFATSPTARTTSRSSQAAATCSSSPACTTCRASASTSAWRWSS